VVCLPPILTVVMLGLVVVAAAHCSSDKRLPLPQTGVNLIPFVADDLRRIKPFIISVEYVVGRVSGVGVWVTNPCSRFDPELVYNIVVSGTGGVRFLVTSTSFAWWAVNYGGTEVA